MRPEHFAKLYNGDEKTGDPVSGNKAQYVDGASRLFEKQRDQLSGRFNERAAIAYDSSGRESEWTEEVRGSRGSVPCNSNTGREVMPDISEDDEYEEDELDLEATGVPEPPSSGGMHSNSLPQQVQSRDGGMYKQDAPKFSMYPFLNSFTTSAQNASVNGILSDGVATPAATNAGANGVSREGISIAAGGGATTSGYFNPQLTPTQARQQSLRHFLCDPVSGALMEDALIFPCGHSVGAAGFRKVQETSACVVCFEQTSPMSVAPNHALREVVKAFKLEREFPNPTSTRSAKRRREPDDQPQQESGKPKGVQFPYNVSDRVLIKGNKRTPERFVGREAIITTQCLNGWYLVRTTDNGESVRLQYRSLQKL